MRIGRWLLTGHDADEALSLAGQCRNMMSKMARRSEELRRVRAAHEEAKKHLREAVEDKEQLKGMLKVLAPERLDEWKLSRRAEQL